MKRRYAVGSVMAILLVTLFAWAVLATESEMYFSSDKNGQNRVTNIQEGDEIWIAVYDPDENIDCDLRDKIWTDIKIMDPKTGAYIIWNSYAKDCSTAGYKGKDGCTTKGNYLEETGADTGLFVSNTSFQVGTRENYTHAYKNTHVVDDDPDGDASFQWGHYLYNGSGTWATANVDGDIRGWFDANLVFQPGLMGPGITEGVFPSVAVAGEQEAKYLVGRFENMDTLVGMYQDQNDDSDVAVTMGKIIDTKATISWDKEVYKDPRGAATITVVDPDENLNCNKVEYVPVFIIVNPGSWNPVDTPQTGQTGTSPTNFCMLKRTGGVKYTDTGTATVGTDPIRWYDIYNSRLNPYADGTAGADGRYYIQYPKKGVHNPAQFASVFDTVSANGVTAVSFYAQETGVNTGVFQLNLNDLRVDLGFNSLDVRDVLVAYYLDPNDFDDFTLATAYIEERQHSITSFTDAMRNNKSLYWIGRDPVYVQVIDANANVDPCCPEQVVVHICDVHGEDDSEWLILDETSSNSPVFFTFSGTQLLPVWDALGVGLANSNGGYQLQLDNWKLEVFNEDSVYARYNDVYYTTDNTGMTGLGDVSTTTAFPPRIDRIRVDNDVSFALMEIADTQVFNGSKVNMYFLDRQGNRVSGYVNSDCVFVEVIDPDQDEDQYRRERIAGFWDGPAMIGVISYAGQNFPFGPMDYFSNHLACGYQDSQTHSVNALLGDTNIFAPRGAGTGTAEDPSHGWAKIYVLNPRNGRWATFDLLETGVATGDFVSVICIDLVGVYDCVPTLGVLPGDTIIAVYQDPSNHSDSAWISIKVGIGGGGTPPGQASTTRFTDAQGNVVTTYTDADNVYVKVIDPSHAGAASILQAVEINGAKFDLSPLAGAATDTFITAAISMANLGVGAGDSITATYTDPTDPMDQSSDTVSIIASKLDVTGFIAKPNPFATEVTFTFAAGSSGIATTFLVTVYDLSGHVVWKNEVANTDKVVWNGTNKAGMALANGPYIYTAMATDGTDTFTGKGKVFIKR